MCNEYKPINMWRSVKDSNEDSHKEYTQNDGENVLIYKNMSIDTDKRSVSVEGVGIELTKTEYELLKYLVSNKGTVLSRDQIMKQVWGYDYIGVTNVIDVYIRYLRTKLDEKFNTKFIYTIRGVGYSVE